MQADAGTLLQVANHAEKIPGLGIATRSEHADQALGRCAGGFAELLEADGCLDVVAQNRLAGVDIAAQHRVDPFAKQRLGEFLVGLDPSLHQFLEALCFCHRLAPSAFAALVILPVETRRIYVALLPLLGSTDQQDDDRLTIPSKINSIARTKIDPILQNAISHAFDIREIALLHACERTGNLGTGSDVQSRKPFGKGLFTARSDVVA